MKFGVLIVAELCIVWTGHIKRTKVLYIEIHCMSWKHEHLAMGDLSIGIYSMLFLFGVHRLPLNA